MFTTLSKDPLDITRREFDHLFDIPLEEFTPDEENLILWELGHQQGKNLDELKHNDHVNPYIISNTLITLLNTYNLSSFNVVLEILRQTEDIINFDLPDYKGFTYILPMLTKVFEYKPESLKNFMLEEGIIVRGKQIVAELLSRVGRDYINEESKISKKVHDQIVDIFSAILDTNISNYPQGNICDKQVVSHVVKAIVNAGLVELSDKFKIVYDNDMVDKQICGELHTNLFILKDLGSADMNYIETNLYALMFIPLDFLWSNEDNLDFGGE